MERPAKFAGTGIESANVAGRRGKRFGIAAADNEEILVNDCRTGERNERFGIVAAEIFAKIDAAIFAEGWNGLAGCGVQRVNEVHYADQNALVIVGGPRGEAAVRLRADDTWIELPQNLAGGTIEGEDFLRRRDSVQNAIKDDWAGLETARFLCIEGPSLPQGGDIFAINLAKGRIVSVAGRPAVHWPVLGRVALILVRARRKERYHRERTRCRRDRSGEDSKFHGASLTWKSLSYGRSFF